MPPALRNISDGPQIPGSPTAPTVATKAPVAQPLERGLRPDLIFASETHVAPASGALPDPAIRLVQTAGMPSHILLYTRRLPEARCREMPTRRHPQDGLQRVF